MWGADPEVDRIASGRQRHVGHGGTTNPLVITGAVQAPPRHYAARVVRRIVMNVGTGWGGFGFECVQAVLAAGGK